MHVWILLLKLWPGPSDCPFPVPLLVLLLKFMVFSKSFHLFHLPACQDHPLLWAHGAASAHVSCCLSWLRRLDWRSSQGWLLVAPRGILPSTTMCRCMGLPCPWGIVGSDTLCSRPASVITVLLSADSSCRDQWKTSWVANLDSSLWTFRCFPESNVLTYKAVAPAVFAGLDKSRNACTLYLYYRAGLAL